MNKHIISILVGIFSGLTWSIDTLIISATVGSIIFITLLHDASACLINITGIKHVIFRKNLILGFVAGALGNLGFIGASMLGGPVLGVITSSSMPIVTYLFTGKYNLKKTIAYTVGAILLGSLSNVSGEMKITTVVLFGLLCVFGWSYETIVVEKNAQDLPYDTIVFMRMMVGIIFFFPIALILKTPIDISIVPIITIAGLIGGISYRAWYCAVLNLGAPIGNSLNLTYLIFTILFSTGSQNKIIHMMVGLIYLLLIFYIDRLNSQEVQ